MSTSHAHVDRGSVAGNLASQNDRESAVLLNMISVVQSNIQLYMLSSKC